MKFPEAGRVGVLRHACGAGVRQPSCNSAIMGRARWAGRTLFDNTGEGMADRFEDLGLSSELVTGVEALGWEAPSALQRDALPVIRRGNNVVLYASAGSGVVGAYGLGILDRLAAEAETGTEERKSPRALVLVPDHDSASRTADSLAPMAALVGLTARAHGVGWTPRPVDILVLSPTDASAAVRDSALKLDGIRTLVIDGVDQLNATGQWDELETMVDIIPGGAQRIAVTGRLDPRIEGFIERHVRKAMSVPPRPTAEEAGAAGGPPVRYHVVPAQRRVAAVVSLLGAVEAAQAAIVRRTREGAESLRRALEARGVDTGADASNPQVLVLPRTEADRRSTKAEVISADVPMDVDEMHRLHDGGGTVLVTPRERAHLLRIAKRAGIPLEAAPDARAAIVSPAEVVRDRIRSLLDDGELAADLALVEPLLDEYPAAEIAAAAMHLARSREWEGPTRSSVRVPGSAAAPGGAAVGKRPGAGAPPPPTATTWTHLFVTVGSRDDVSPGDIVGAMTGEAGISGDQVGKIDIRESHTTVEVATPVADQVITALNGRTLKGRSLRVDYDRKTRAPRKPGGSRSGGSGRRSGGPGGKGGGGGGRPPRRG